MANNYLLLSSSREVPYDSMGRRRRMLEGQAVKVRRADRIDGVKRRRRLGRRSSLAVLCAAECAEAGSESGSEPVRKKAKTRGEGVQCSAVSSTLEKTRQSETRATTRAMVQVKMM